VDAHEKIWSYRKHEKNKTNTGVEIFMKIALLCNGLGVVERGSEKFAHDFFNHMKDVYDITLFGATDTKTKTRNEINIPWRNGRAYYESYLFGKHLHNHNKLKDYDVILNNAGFPCSYWCSKIRKKHNIPFITRARGGGKEEYLSRVFKPDMMIFLSKYHMNGVAGKNTKATVVPNAIEIPDQRTLKQPTLERPIFLSTSALVKFKRIDLIIKAVHGYGKGTLILTSDGTEKAKLLNLGNTLLKNRFIYAGKVKEDFLDTLYYGSDYYMHSAKQDAFPNVYLEALSHNLPIIAQGNKRSREILGDGAMFVNNCEDVREFVSAIDKAVEKDWGTIPLEKAKEYSWENMKKNYIELIEEVVA